MHTIRKGSGKPLGTVLIQGSIAVSGFKNGDWHNLNGSGYVDGDLTYSDGK